LSYLFVLAFKKVLSKAMSESALKKLIKEVKEIEFEKKFEGVRRKQVEREIVEQVCLT
jgi:hypothetical protein